MYPQTYFLVSLLIGVIATKFHFLTIPQAFIAAVVAVLIDLDHFASAWHASRNFRAAWRNALNNHLEDTFLHSWRGFAAFAVVKGTVFMFSKPWALVLAIAYWSHLFLDTIHMLFRDAAQKHFAMSDANFAIRAVIAELTISVFSLLMSVLYLKFA